MNMKLTGFNDKFRFIANRSKKDPEKCILPTILYINTNHSSFNELRHRGFMIVVGWWDYSIKVGLFY